jgi:hypothetical protein
MTTYISLDAALKILENAYLVSAFVLLAGSYIGLAAIAKSENSDDSSPLPKWF